MNKKEIRIAELVLSLLTGMISGIAAGGLNWQSLFIDLAAVAVIVGVGGHFRKNAPE